MSGKATRRAGAPIDVRRARVHNLKNISVDIPRDRIFVVTGASGFGKSSLVFNTVTAEAQENSSLRQRWDFEPIPNSPQDSGEKAIFLSSRPYLRDPIKNPVLDPSAWLIYSL